MIVYVLEVQYPTYSLVGEVFTTVEAAQIAANKDAETQLIWRDFWYDQYLSTVAPTFDGEIYRIHRRTLDDHQES